MFLVDLLSIPKTMTIHELIDKKRYCEGYYGCINDNCSSLQNCMERGFQCGLRRIYDSWRKQSLIIPSVEFCPFYSSFEIEKKQHTDRFTYNNDEKSYLEEQLLERGRHYCNLRQVAFVVQKPCETRLLELGTDAYPDNCKFACWLNRIVKDMKKSSNRGPFSKKGLKPYLSFYKKVSQTDFYDDLLNFITLFFYDCNPYPRNQRIRLRIGRAIASKCLDTKACPYKSIAELIKKS